MTARTLLFSLRAAAIAGALLFAAFAAAAPFLVEGQTIRRQLEERLSEITGGTVESIGRIRLASFIALTVEVEDVKLRGVTRLGHVGGIEARSVKAVISFYDLLSGSLGFSKLIIADVDIDVAKGELPDFNVERIPEFLRLALNTPNPTVETIRVRDARLRFDGRQGSEVLTIASLQYEQSSRRRWMRVQTAPAPSRVTFQMRSNPAASGGFDVSMALRGPGFDTAFAGRVANDGQVLAGTVHLAVTDPAAFDAAAAASLRPVGQSADVSGTLHFVNGSWALEDAALRFGRSSGAGYVNLRASGGVLAVDGTVSWSVLNLHDIQSLLESVRGPEAQTPLEGDVRISADRVEGLPMTLGSAAAAISVKDGRLIADVAEVALYGGTARGRIEANLSRGRILALGATVEDVDIRDFTSALGIEAPLAGRADIGADLRLAAGRSEHDGGFDGLEGSLRIAMPDPAIISAPLSHGISDAFRAASPPLSLPVPLPMNEITVDAALGAVDVDFRLRGEMPSGAELRASGRVSRAGGKLRGEIEVQGPSLLAAAMSPPGGSPPSRVMLGGSLSEILFLNREGHSLSN